MKNTAHAAHITQIPTITSHFSISPTLANPVYLFCVPGKSMSPAARRRISGYRRAKSFDKAYFKKNHARETTERNRAGPAVEQRPETHAQ
ncbi:hypothetical protein LJ655_09630 [Paraburkholderia sp. MMS20-SJTN17]|uniref:Uncharacterized protein n=1 Tax=Paraburkholderia translucens TaxID=2886945 RepID=A0ABS8KBK3_9BURK|nr:hypothetical protein [Paraburkholderia sp. MMS20-SJTN17]MCC8402150.1 hypothetical protein [Paraburkholderia sp. MMS20-SJTN17]